MLMNKIFIHSFIQTQVTVLLLLVLRLLLLRRLPSMQRCSILISCLTKF